MEELKLNRPINIYTTPYLFHFIAALLGYKNCVHWEGTTKRFSPATRNQQTALNMASFKSPERPNLSTNTTYHYFEHRPFLLQSIAHGLAYVT
jgi:hypothetical protein